MRNGEHEASAFSLQSSAASLRRSAGDITQRREDAKGESELSVDPLLGWSVDPLFR